METIQYCFKLQYCYHHIYKGQLLHILLSCYCTSVHLSQVKLFSSNWLLTPSIKVGWCLPINFWLSRISGMEYWNDPNCVLYLPKSQNGIFSHAQGGEAPNMLGTCIVKFCDCY